MKLGKIMKKVVIIDGPHCGEIHSIGDNQDTISIIEREALSAIDYSVNVNVICNEVQNVNFYYIHGIISRKPTFYFGSESATLDTDDILNILVNRFSATAAHPDSSSEAQ